MVYSFHDDLICLDTRILLSVELYDQQHNECSIPFDSFFITLTSNSTFTSSNLPLQYDIHSRKYTALFEPTQNDMYVPFLILLHSLDIFCLFIKKEDSLRTTCPSLK